MLEEDVYKTIGEDGFRRLVAAFYRQVPDDSILGPMYPREDLEGAEYRLCMFLIGRFGGPPTYIEERGHPRLRRRHIRLRIGPAERDAWMLCMGAALDEVVADPAVRELLHGAFLKLADWVRNDSENPHDKR